LLSGLASADNEVDRFVKDPDRHVPGNFMPRGKSAKPQLAQSRIQESILKMIQVIAVAAAASVLLASHRSFAAGQDGAREDESWLQRRFSVTGQAWVYSSEFFSPTRYNRQMNFMTIEAARGWRFSSGLEAQLRVGLAHTNGVRLDPPSNGASRDSTTTGTTGGLDLRFYVLDLRRTHVFVAGSAQYYWSPRQQFPAGGSGINGLFRTGIGIVYDLTRDTAIEAIYRNFAHISNGGKPPENPTWEGEGGGVALRHRF
jgi:hypothetical protein